MAGTGKNLDSLRVSRFEMERLGWALTLSVLLHVMSWGGYEMGKKLGWWHSIHWPTWLRHFQSMAVFPQPPPAPREEPLEFATVDQPALEPPKNAKYYSSHNSHAADLEGKRDTDTPKVDGKQPQMPDTTTTPRQHFDELQPMVHQSPPGQEQEPGNPVSPGDLTLGNPKPADKPPADRPRTINEALRRANQPPRQMMQQDGGVRSRMGVAALDVKATAFGAYDAALVDAVRQRWYDLLDRNSYAYDRAGSVIVSFRLHADGRVTDLQIEQDTADDSKGGIWAIVCQASIEESAPFGPWPHELLSAVGSNYRDVRFKFFY